MGPYRRHEWPQCLCLRHFPAHSPLPIPPPSETLIPKGSELRTTKDGMKWTLGALIGQGAFGKVCCRLLQI